MSSRLRKESRVFCEHCNEYLSRSAFWKHRKRYYDVHNERWTNKGEAERLGQEEKRAKHDHDARVTMDGDFIWPSESSSDEELEVVYGEGMKQPFKILGNDDQTTYKTDPRS